MTRPGERCRTRPPCRRLPTDGRLRTADRSRPSQRLSPTIGRSPNIQLPIDATDFPVRRRRTARTLPSITRVPGPHVRKPDYRLLANKPKPCFSSSGNGPSHLLVEPRVRPSGTHPGLGPACGAPVSGRPREHLPGGGPGPDESFSGSYAATLPQQCGFNTSAARTACTATRGVPGPPRRRNTRVHTTHHARPVHRCRRRRGLVPG